MKRINEGITNEILGVLERDMEECYKATRYGPYETSWKHEYPGTNPKLH